jgi:type IV secretion system protein VirB11
MSASGNNYTALETFLQPLYAFFQEEGVTEISINRPKELWIESYGTMRCEHDDTLDLEHLKSLCRLVAQSTEQYVSEEHPLLSASLPNGFRIQVVFPPACEAGNLALSIRKNSSVHYTLDQYRQMGAFDHVVVQKEVNTDDQLLAELLQKKQIEEFLRKAILLKKNILISGGTSTGKTTFTNAVLCEIPNNERLITCEDTREIQLHSHPNRVHLLASKGGQGRAKVTTQDLIEACLRLRPDRIIVGELRGSEAFSFLRAINTGHPGSVATLHADSPLMAFEQLTLMILQAGLEISPNEIRHYIKQVVDIVVQLKRLPNGTRYVSEIYFKPLVEVA